MRKNTVLSIGAVDDVYKLIELRRVLDKCQYQLRLVLAENGELKIENMALRKRLNMPIN